MLQVSPTILAALTEPTVSTLRDLIVEYGFSLSEPLTALTALQEVLDNFELDADPPIGRLGLDDERVLKKKLSQPQVSSRVLELIDQGEGPRVEFKSSIFISTKKKQFNPGISIEECVDDSLKEKVAKEIAAFLNAEGGTILFGVTDDGDLRGCEDDFSTFSSGGSPGDKADLILKQIVSQHFREPDNIFYHLKIDCVDIDGKHIVMLSVASRKQLAFLKSSKPSQLYLRVSSHALPIPYEKIEQYYNLSKL
nr:ATP-binding protein [Thalassovita aquimarina]